MSSTLEAGLAAKAAPSRLALGIDKTNLWRVASFAALETDDIPASVKRVTVEFFAPHYAVPATLQGGARYVARSDNPGHPLAVQSSVDGRWWEIENKTITPEMAGGDPADADSATAAINMAAQVGRPIELSEVEYKLRPQAMPARLRMRGRHRYNSIVKWVDAAGTISLMRIGGGVVDWQLENLTIDADNDNHLDSAGYFAAIDLLNIADTSVVRVHGVTFRNGRIIDIRVDGPKGNGETATVSILDCEFSGGLLSTNATDRAAQCIAVSEGVVLFAKRNRFSSAAPDGVTTFGRGGIVMQRPAGSTNLAWGAAFVSENYFVNMGKAPNNLGCVYIYSGHKTAIISGNHAENVYGTAYTAKGDGGSIVIANNTVNGQRGDTSGVIGIIGQGDSYTSTIGKHAVISGNTILGAEGRCIYVDGQFADALAGAGKFFGVIIANNITNGGMRSVDIRNVTTASIVDNIFKGAGAGIFSAAPLSGTIRISGNSISDTAVGISLSGVMVDANLLIHDNSFQDLSGAAIGLGAAVRRFAIRSNDINGCGVAFVTSGATGYSVILDNTAIGTTGSWSKSGSYTGGLWYDRNQCNSSTVAVRTVALSANASGQISVFAGMHYVDTVGGASTGDLATIDGGMDGDVISLRAANGDRTIVVKDGSNIQINGDFALDNAQDSINLQKVGTTWYEISRINLAA